MDNQKMIERLQAAGISFEAGLTADEIEHAESLFGFRFPQEIKSFLSCALPVGEDFFNWRDWTETNLEKFNAFQQNIEDSCSFDVDHCEGLLREFLGDLVTKIKDKETLRQTVFSLLHQSPRLIPFYAHRCFFDGMDDMPILSFWQPIDTIIYGSDFENYLENEFLRDPLDTQPCPISDRMQETGIWAQLIVD